MSSDSSWNKTHFNTNTLPNLVNTSKNSKSHTSNNKNTKNKTYSTCSPRSTNSQSVVPVLFSTLLQAQNRKIEVEKTSKKSTANTSNTTLEQHEIKSKNLNLKYSEILQNCSSSEKMKRGLPHDTGFGWGILRENCLKFIYILVFVAHAIYRNR